MKNIEKYIYLILIVILVAVVASGATYMVMKDKNSNNNTVVEKEDSQEKEENITLSEKELKKYLSYVPRDIMAEENNMYKSPNSVEKMDYNVLISSAVSYADTYYLDLRQNVDVDDTTFAFKTNDINNIMQEIYNKKIVNLIESEEPIGTFGCRIISYVNGSFKVEGGCGYNGSHKSEIDSYIVNDNELVIYEYAAEVESFYDKDYYIIRDYYTQKETKLDSEILEDDNTDNYFKNNKEKFTKYKHTFKKNETGYYWYSTEVAD